MPYGCPACQHCTLPPAVQPSNYRLCAGCGLHFDPEMAQLLAPRDEPRFEALPLFTPAPAVMPGQTTMGA